MKVEVHQTHMEIFPYSKHDLPILEKMYTSIDGFTKEEIPCGYLVEEGRLFLPRGTPVSKVEHLTQTKAVYMDQIDPMCKMKGEPRFLNDPKDDLQEQSIRFLIHSSNPQLALNIFTGRGKTFCVAYAISKLKERALVITHNEGIKKQWYHTFRSMFGYQESNILNISGSNIMEYIATDMVLPADVCLVNHQTLRSYLSHHSPIVLHNFFRKLEIGVKVYDEAHLEFANILFMDFFSNTNRTWYLTATFDRSDKSQSKCFKQAFSSVETFGESESRESMEKHIIYHVIRFSSRIDYMMLRKVSPYHGFTGASYGRYAFLGMPEYSDPNDTAYIVMKKVVNMMKDVEGKMLIFVPLIDAVNLVADQLRRDFPDKKVATFHSKTERDEKEEAFSKDIIVSTLKSCGTGKDIPGLRTVISAEPIASKVFTEQMLGRLRPYADKDTYFFDLIDVSIPTCNYWWRSRFKKIETLVKKIVHLNIDG